MPRNNESLGYRNKKGETRFEAMFRYSDEKENTAKTLSRVLMPLLKKDATLFDLGAGNGEFLLNVLKQSGFKKSLNVTLLEPSKDLFKKLKRTVRKFPRNNKIMIVQKKWENYIPKKKFDVVLVSHAIYGFRRKNWKRMFAKMIKYMKPDGHLIFITRHKDDTYRFKMLFRPLFFGKTFKAVELGECVRLFKQIFVEKGLAFHSTMYKSCSKLYFPLHEQPQDAIALIEFYLVKSWNNIPKEIKSKILGFIERHGCVFKQIDGIAVMRKRVIGYKS